VENSGSLPFEIDYTKSFAQLLDELRLTIAVSSHQANKLILLRHQAGRVSALLRTFPGVTGLAARANDLAIATRREVWLLENSPELAARLPGAFEHDACYLPRTAFFTGDIQAHELCWTKSGLWIVNTLFSCLCTLDPKYSFVPRWQPPFISQLRAEDRCHLNGLAADEHGPRFVTALARSDTPDGWRNHGVNGGVLIDVTNQQILAENLCLPHSPRLSQNAVWLCESGTGRIISISLDGKRVDVVAQLPGYVRGMVIRNDLLFVGLSRLRRQPGSDLLPISLDNHLECGVWILDIVSGRTLASLRFLNPLDELFEIQLLDTGCFSALFSPYSDEFPNLFLLP
jgi:uncharacterized protein (TIGR03032 family)